ncbi:hypothetical protein [Chryseobacterium phocaeense]|uniref:hypothetical protein n=1 Tax=Chryseobacterium phocaeense TaxID=1816690 RepID=UPI001119BCA7|nr:hypothetical protein [Chryseobacterium phocaeense]
MEELDKIKILEFLKLQMSKKKFVVTPISILKKCGFPVSKHHFLLENKAVILTLKYILKELSEDGFLIPRESKQDFKGVKEIGYDFITY